MYVARTFMWIEHSQEKNEKKRTGKEKYKKGKEKYEFKINV